MKKNVVIKIVVFVASVLLGTAASFYFYKDFFTVLKFLYEWNSNGTIEFYGKYFLFPSLYAVVLFGLSSGIVLYHVTFTQKGKLIHLFLWSFIFVLATVIQSYLDAIAIKASCTACSGDVFKIHISNVSDARILSTSSVVSLVPSIFFFLKSKKT